MGQTTSLQVDIDHRPLVADAPRFSYIGNSNIRLLYRMPGYGANDFTEVIGDPAGGGYEWVIRGDDGKLVRHSDDGYGCSTAAMRDGLLAHDGCVSARENQLMAQALRMIVQADERVGLLANLRDEVAAQGGECADQHSWLIEALQVAHTLVAKLDANRPKTPTSE